MRHTLPLAFLLSTGVLLTACQDRLDDPDAIADRLAARTVENYEGVHDFTVRGDGVVVYFRRTGADSLAQFEGRAFTDDSLRQPVPIPYALPNGMQLASGLHHNAVLAGTTELRGETAYVLDAISPALLLGRPGGAPTRLDSVRVLVDAGSFQVREVRMTTPQTSLDPAADSTAPPLVQRQLYGDFRTVQGLTLPFQVSTRISGVVVPEDARAVEGGMLELRRRRAQQLPPAERERVLREVEERERFLRSGEMEQAFTVEEVRVNAGVPEDAFAAPAVGG